MNESETHHPHRWWSRRCQGELIGSYYEPPYESVEFGEGKARGAAAHSLLDLYRKAVEGVTTLTYRCSRCSRVWTTTHPGRVTGIPGVVVKESAK